MAMKKELMIGILSGAVLGTAAGVMLAPRSGKETREALMVQLGRFRQRALRNGGVRRLSPIAAHRSGEDS